MSIHGDFRKKQVGSCTAGILAPIKLVDDTFVDANTGDIIELHGLSWVRTDLTSAPLLKSLLE